MQWRRISTSEGVGEVPELLQPKINSPITKEEVQKYTVSVDGRRGIVLYSGVGMIAGSE